MNIYFQTQIKKPNAVYIGLFIIFLVLNFESLRTYQTNT